MGKIRKCTTCKIYTFKEMCPKCGIKTINPNPPRFSPIDKFGKYRRKLKIEEVSP
ncbi:MAG: RNA-protein complex protein Nop10 [Candidatus Aenigmatarchaeota archaeon]